MEFDKHNIENAFKDILILSGLQPVNVSEHNYWFLRTQGGEYFDEFFMNDYVAIGWDDVPCKAENERTDELKDKLKTKYGQPTRVLNQVYRFCKEMKKGDIIIIPSSASIKLAFGRILDEEIFEYDLSDEEKEDNNCPYRRRRKVEWLKIGKRNMVDPKLFAFFRNQQALAIANDYAEFIERAINPFYIKDNIAHLNLSVNISKSPKATDIPYFILGINEQMKNLTKELGIELEEPESRINVQSKGIIEFMGTPLTIFVFGYLLIAICGGEFSLFGFKIKSDGLIKTITEAYSKIKNINTIADEEKLKEIQERLDIEDPRDNK